MNTTPDRLEQAPKPVNGQAVQGSAEQAVVRSAAAQDELQVPGVVDTTDSTINQEGGEADGMAFENTEAAAPKEQAAAPEG